MASGSTPETPNEPASAGRGALAAVVRAAFRPTDVASLALFRILLGGLLVVSAWRFFSNDWIDRFFVQPSFHFKYWGFAWVKVGPPWVMYLAFAALLGLSLLVMVGLFYRAAIVLLFLLFTYLQLIDVTLYLNHYYLVSLLCLLLAFLPAQAAMSLDALRRPDRWARRQVPALAIWVLRLQVGLVYTCAGLAKLQPDWLLEAQPLRLWLASLTDLPLLGPLLAVPAAPYVAAWAGFLFDSTIALFLSLRRTRAFAFVAVLVFHTLTGLFFPIGMFPLIMIVAATVFFPTDWPRRLAARLARWRPARGKAAPREAEAVAAVVVPGQTVTARQRLALVAFAAFALVQLALPFRYRLYGGNVLWDEQGMRFSWRVMVREKNASVTYVVSDPASGRRWHVSPRDYLRDHQERDFATQPDLIWQLAQRIGSDFRAREGVPVQVRAEVTVSLNGRRASPLIDPNVDLLRQQDGLAPKSWILGAPRDRPVPFIAVK